MKAMIDCREAVRHMWTYLSQSLERAEADELERHLEACQRCCGELEFARELRDRIASVETERMPRDIRARVDDLLRRGTAGSGEQP